VLARPQGRKTEAPLEDLLARPQLVESLVRVLVSSQPEEPHSKCFLTLRRRRRWKTCLLLLRR